MSRVSGFKPLPDQVLPTPTDLQLFFLTCEGCARKRFENFTKYSFLKSVFFLFSLSLQVSCHAAVERGSAVHPAEARPGANADHLRSRAIHQTGRAQRLSRLQRLRLMPHGPLGTFFCCCWRRDSEVSSLWAKFPVSLSNHIGFTP